MLKHSTLSCTSLEKGFNSWKCKTYVHFGSRPFFGFSLPVAFFRLQTGVSLGYALLFDPRNERYVLRSEYDYWQYFSVNATANISVNLILAFVTPSSMIYHTISKYCLLWHRVFYISNNLKASFKKWKPENSSK